MKNPQKLPILIALPHSTSFLPEEALKTIKLKESRLNSYFDIGSSEIFSSDKFEIVSANFSRIFCDLNRAPDHFEKRTKSSNREGVVIQKTDTFEDIYMEKLTDTEIKNRVLEHEAYYKLVQEKIVLCDAKFFIAGHSMAEYPPNTEPSVDNRRPDIVISNNDFATCDAKKTEILKDLFEKFGYSVKVNVPFKGGFLLNYFCHRDRLPGVQIEVSQAGFLNKAGEIDMEKVKEYQMNFEQIFINFLEKI